MPKPTIVLVHGAWADGSSWNAVATELQGQGFTVLTPPNLLRGVAGDAAYIASFLAQRTSGPVVLVGHSYGGFVITNAGDRRRRRARRSSTSTRSSPTRARPSSRSSAGPARRSTSPTRPTVLDLAGYPGAPEGDAEAFLKPATVHDSFAQDLPEADRWLIVASQRPITLGANTTPSETAGVEDASRAGPSSAPRTGSSRRPRSAAWPSAPARRSPRWPGRTCRWCRTRRSRSTRSSPPSPPSTSKPADGVRPVIANVFDRAVLVG